MSNLDWNLAKEEILDAAKYLRADGSEKIGITGLINLSSCLGPPKKETCDDEFELCNWRGGRGRKKKPFRSR